MIKNPASMKEILRSQNSSAISRQVSSASLLNISGGNYQRALVDDSGMIITQMGKHNRSEIVAVQWTLCTIPPCNSNNNAG
jgi:hypothetical protein